MSVVRAALKRSPAAALIGPRECAKTTRAPRMQAGAELDLLLLLRGERIGIEVKYVDAPRMTTSMRSALTDLGLARLLVVYPGSTRYALAPKVEALSLEDCLEATRA